MGGTSRRYLEALRDYMVQEARRQRNVYKREVDDIYFFQENWTLISASESFSKMMTEPKNNIS